MVLRLLLCAGGLFLMTNLNSQDLNDFKWKNRIVIVECADHNNLKYKDQMDEFSNSEIELKDRKILIIERVGNQYRKSDYLSSNPNSEWQKSENRLSAIHDFKVKLIGLDGGTKLEKDTILTKEELMGLIDSMPMRKWEMRKK